MEKKVELNQLNVKKCAKVITVKRIVLNILSLAFLFVPVAGGESIVAKMSEVINGTEIGTEHIVCMLHFALIGYYIISSWIKVVLFKDKTKINNSSSAVEILKSPFIKFINNHNRAMLFWFTNFFILLFFPIVGAKQFDERYSTWAIGSALLSLLCMFVDGSVPESINPIPVINELQKQANAEKLGIELNNLSAPTSTPSMKDQKSNLDALLKYKNLYESGAITEEEYNAKKDELLNK